MTRHTDALLLQRYAATELDATDAAGVEAHLMGCAACRGALNERVAPVAAPRLDAVWNAVTADLDAPRPAPVERLLLRLGVRDDMARLLAATPALHLSWLLAVVATLAFAVAAAHAAPRGELVFLALAPLVPLAGIATAYGPGVDPAYEIGLSAPMRSFRLLFIRAAAVLVTSILLAGAASVALPALGWPTAAWLLPALALSLLSLALAGTFEPVWAAAGIGFGWTAAMLMVAVGRTAAASLLGPTAQLTWAVLAVVTVIVIALRRDRYDIANGKDT